MLRHWLALLLGLVVAMPAYSQEGQTRLDPNGSVQDEKAKSLATDSPQ